MRSDVGIPLLVLQGTPYEVGLQYGTLLRREILDAMAVGDQAFSPILRRANLTDSVVGERNAAYAALLPDALRDEFRGVAEGAGVPLQALIDHNAVLDFLAGAPVGCSQFAVFGRSTRDGGMLHGHNLDIPYPLVSQWSRPICVVRRIEHYLPFFSITFWPTMIGVCAGMNRAGLTLGMNAPSGPADVRTYTPPLLLNRSLLTQAGSVEQARAMVAAAKLGGNWILMLTQGPGAARVWEQSGPYSGEYEPDPNTDRILATNHLLKATGAATGYDAAVRELIQEMQDHSFYRYHRLEALIADSRGKIDMNTAVSFLQDLHDPTGGPVPSINTVCRQDNILSMVYAPDCLTVDLAAGQAPAALGRRRRVDLRRFLHDGLPPEVRPAQAVPVGEVEASWPGFPMVGTQSASGRWERAFSLAEDIYLEEHRVNRIPVLPGASAVEWMAEVASAAGAGEVAEMRNVRFERFIRIRPEQELRAWIDVTHSDGWLNLSASAPLVHPNGTLLQAAVPHYYGEFRTGRRQPVRVDPEMCERRGSDGEIDFTRPYVEQGYFYVGKRFRCVEWVSYLSNSEVMGRLRVPETTGHFSSIPSARFWINPFLLDGCFQVAGTLGIINTLCCPVPGGIGHLMLGHEPQPGHRVWFWASLDRQEQDRCYYRFQVWDDENQLCLAATDFCSVSVDAYTEPEKQQIIDGLDPNRRLCCCSAERMRVTTR